VGKEWWGKILIIEEITAKEYSIYTREYAKLDLRLALCIISVSFISTNYYWWTEKERTGYKEWIS